MADVVSVAHVQARWAYSELLSPSHGHYYNGPGIQELKEKSAQSVPFDTLGGDEFNLLVRKFNKVRGGYFNRYFIGITAFELEHWTKDQLGAVYVIPYFLPRVGVKPATFKHWVEAKPHGPLPEHHSADSTGSSLMQDHPVTVGRDAGTMFLLDGYHRAIRFWSSNDPAFTLAVFAPS
jgi:hypothetical protein